MGAGTDSLAASRLGRLAARAAREREAVQEQCELCGAPIQPEHRHLFDLSRRELMCACRACAILFDREAAGAGHYRIVPDRRLRIDGLELSDLMWEELRLPVEMAFFFHNSAAARVQAFYPSPMGATESLLTFDLDVLHTLEPDVEALLVDRHKGAREHWMVPIDDCFRLVGLIRTHWQGLTGGRDVWVEIGRFFDGLERR